MTLLNKYVLIPFSGQSSIPGTRNIVVNKTKVAVVIHTLSGRLLTIFMYNEKTSLKAETKEICMEIWRVNCSAYYTKLKSIVIKAIPP